VIRGTRFNQGTLLKDLIAQGADAIGDPTQAHMVAIDARAPLYDGGIVHAGGLRVAGLMVNRDARRFYDEGEDFWPKRYAIWGRLVAQQPGQVAHSIIDAKAVGRFMPPVFKGCAGRHAARTRAPARSGRTVLHADHQRLQRRLPRRHLRPRGAGRLPYRRPDAAQDALGPAHRHSRRSTATRSSRV
jgi:hypothetical protein